MIDNHLVRCSVLWPDGVHFPSFLQADYLREVLCAWIALYNGRGDAFRGVDVALERRSVFHASANGMRP